MRLELHVSMDGASFADDEMDCSRELARILRKAADGIEIDGYELNGVRRIKDVSGNRCGYWVVTDAPLPADV